MEMSSYITWGMFVRLVFCRDTLLGINLRVYLLRCQLARLFIEHRVALRNRNWESAIQRGVYGIREVMITLLAMCCLFNWIVTKICHVGT